MGLFFNIEAPTMVHLQVFQELELNWMCASLKLKQSYEGNTTDLKTVGAQAAVQKRYLASDWLITQLLPDLM